MVIIGLQIRDRLAELVGDIAVLRGRQLLVLDDDGPMLV